MLCVHAFWYCFCSLRQPSSEAEQHALFKLMSQQVLRCTRLPAQPQPAVTCAANVCR